ncbi:MAG: SGNH/GDSL hydrolase family protein [Verrucomicrobia bacterium]|nr:SGNH/GDSL hydrolase family protein [Verrucomicrobiota bacterium]
MSASWFQKRARLYGLLCLLVTVAIVRIIWERPSSQKYHGWWESQIREFEERDKTNSPPKGAVLIVGSSSIRLWNIAKADLGPHPVFKRGFGGSCISDVIHYAERIILKYEPSVVVVYAGDNDVAALKTNEQILKDFKALVKMIHEALPETRIGFLSIKPSLARWKLRIKMKRVNAAVQAFAQATPYVDYIDIFKPMLNEKGRPKIELFMPDGLHMNPNGYKIWSNSIKTYLGRLDLQTASR